MMDHPNIAQIFDAGATTKGHPLRQGLSVELQQSPFLSMISDQQGNAGAFIVRQCRVQSPLSADCRNRSEIRQWLMPI
jgi:hypothetical protein